MPAPKRICRVCGKRAKYLARIWIDGQSQYLGYTCTQAHRREAQEAAKRAFRAEAEQALKPKAETITCDEWADRWLAKVEREQKASSLGTARQALKAFRAEFGHRPIGSIDDVEAEDWILGVPPSSVPPTVTAFNYAVKMRVIGHNPFAGKGTRPRGRADKAPPTEKEFQALLDACDVLGGYGPQMRALVDFGSLTLMRPSELYELRYPDVDLATNRIHKDRRLYRGQIDTPKTGKRTIALPPPARDLLMRQPSRTREDGLVFVSKQGKQLTSPTVTQYWSVVRARAGLDFELYWYKHFGVHRLFKLGLSKRAIAAQAGWSEDAVDGLLRVYGHADLVALSEVDALYAMHESMHEAAEPAS
jgi:integrase